MINRTRTDVGSRLLKATILGPPTDVLTINTRLDLVQAFLHSEAANWVALGDALSSLPKLDKLLTGIATVAGSQQAASAKARRNIDTLIALKATLALFPEIAECMRDMATTVESKSKGAAGGSQGDTALFLSAVAENCTFEESIAG